LSILWQGNVMTIVTSSFSKSFVSKMFSLHTKTQSRRFHFIRFEERFRKAPDGFRDRSGSVGGRPDWRNFICYYPSLRIGSRWACPAPVASFILLFRARRRIFFPVFYGSLFAGYTIPPCKLVHLGKTASSLRSTSICHETESFLNSL